MLYYTSPAFGAPTIPGNLVFTTAQSRPGVSFSLMLVPTPLRYSNSLAWGTLQPHPLNYGMRYNACSILPSCNWSDRSPPEARGLWDPKGRNSFSNTLSTAITIPTSMNILFLTVWSFPRMRTFPRFSASPFPYSRVPLSRFSPLHNKHRYSTNTTAISMTLVPVGPVTMCSPSRCFK